MGKLIKKYRNAQITATIFENEKTVEEKPVIFHSVLVEKSYKTNDEEWKKTNNFSISDLPKIESVVRKAYEYLSVIQDEGK
ncbi:MAG: hypothetical protein ABEK36_05305 [Candidatus Aenigmatarchaeota archaeon]